MKELIWNDTLSVEVDEVDEDHRRLVDLYNILNHAVEDEDSPDYIEALLEELISCTVWHFRHEERLMLKFNYGEFADHKAEHEDLIKSSWELQQKFLSQGKQLTTEDIEFLEIWLTRHILTTDMRLGAYLNSVM